MTVKEFTARYDQAEETEWSDPTAAEAQLQHIRKRNKQMHSDLEALLAAERKKGILDGLNRAAGICNREALPATNPDYKAAAFECASLIRHEELRVTDS